MMNDSNETANDLVGTPSDEAPEILSRGGSGITTMFVSMSKRHPDGEDVDYLRWHALDHRPEQYRLAGTRSSLRIVSTPECRAARAASQGIFDAVDHVMTYFFADISNVKGFAEFAVPLAEAGRMPYLLPAVQRGVYEVVGRVAAPRIKAGSDVLPWWPARGMYILIERGSGPSTGLVEAPKVGGVWSGISVASEYTDTEPGQQISYCFLDGDPVEVAERLQPVLKKRWHSTGIEPLLAAPFQIAVPYEWDRYLP